MKGLNNGDYELEEPVRQTEISAGWDFPLSGDLHISDRIVSTGQKSKIGWQKLPSFLAHLKITTPMMDSIGQVLAIKGGHFRSYFSSLATRPQREGTTG